MKINLVLNKLLIVYALVPLIGFVLYLIGLQSINGDLLYPLIELLIIICFVLTIKYAHKNIKIFFLLLLIPLAFNFTASELNLGIDNGAVEWFKIVKNFYFIFLLGYLIYRYYFVNGEINNFFRLIIYYGIFISSFNILFALDDYLNILGVYSRVTSYILTSQPSYSTYLTSNVGLIRPMGYFFDLHSQYYLPLAAMFLLMITKVKIKYGKLFFLLMLVSVLISSVRTAYAILLILSLVSLLIVDRKQKIRIAAVISSVAAILLYLFNELVFEILNQLRGLEGNSQTITSEHFKTIPFILFQQSPITFIFGGDPGMRANLYSEVYLWTLLFYIGVVGLLFYFAPVVMLIRFKKYKIALFFYTLFLLSLIHYKVYNTGINIIVSALPFAFMYEFITKIKLRANNAQSHNPVMNKDFKHNSFAKVNLSLKDNKLL